MAADDTGGAGCLTSGTGAIGGGASRLTLGAPCLTGGVVTARTADAEVARCLTSGADEADGQRAALLGLGGAARQAVQVTAGAMAAAGPMKDDGGLLPPGAQVKVLVEYVDDRRDL